MARQIKDFEKRMEKSLEKAIIKISDIIHNDIQDHFVTYMNKFYRDYYPKRYERQEYIYKASSEYKNWVSHTKGHAHKKGNVYVCGITVSYDNFLENNGGDNDVYNAHDTEWVLNRTFRGIHGFLYSESKNGIKTTNKDGEKIMFHPAFNYPDQNRMNPSPKALMNAWWRNNFEYAKSHKANLKYVDDLCEKIISEELGIKVSVNK